MSHGGDDMDMDGSCSMDVSSDEHRLAPSFSLANPGFLDDMELENHRRLYVGITPQSE